MNADLQAKVDAARVRRGPTGDTQEEPAHDAVVLLSFRVPRSVRDAVHRAAAVSGASSQAWLRDVVEDAVEATLTPHGRLAGELARNLRSRLAEAVDDGRYRELVLADQDPDLM